jgi:hypothetical protein
MNLSTLYRPFELTYPWAAAARRAKVQWPPEPPPGLTDLQRRLVVLHVAQATPSRAADERPAWPGVALICSLIFAGLAVATGAWQ